MSENSENTLEILNNGPAGHICSLLREFYNLHTDWVSGTAGGMSIRNGDYLYFTPSGVQKERIETKDLYVQSVANGFEPVEYVFKPEKFKISACTPLFTSIYQARSDVGGCIHTHSHNAVLISLLYKNEFVISNFENIKAFPHIIKPGNLENFDTLRIPIIDNVPHEENLKPYLDEILEKYPSTSAVIVRRHGIFVWGKDIWKAKVINEALEYLLELTVKMKGLGLPIDSEE